MGRFLAILKKNTDKQDILNAINLIKTGGGQILQIWGKSVFIGNASLETQLTLKKVPHVALVTNDQESVPDLSLFDIDKTTAEIAGALQMGLTEPFPTEWDGMNSIENLFPPIGCGGGVEPVIEDSLADMPLHYNRRSLVGNIGVTILKVDGPSGGPAEFQSNEWTSALLGVSHGMDMLYNLVPNSVKSQVKLVFYQDIHSTSIGVDPTTVPTPADPNNPTPAEFEQNRSSWLYPALSKLGYQESLDGLRDLANDSQFLETVDWNFVCVLTKYQAAWYAYAPAYRDVVISYTMVTSLYSDPDNALPGIFAHETGHTVLAMDEYGNCNPSDLCGFTNTPNSNCEVSSSSVDCLMKNLKATVCSSTVSHFGWGDVDSNGIIDPLDPTFIEP